MKLISNPFSIDPTDAADKYQLELIDIQNDSYLETAFAEHDLLNFYSHYHQTSIPISHRTPGSSQLCFGSTYCCEQLFSRMKNTKSKISAYRRTFGSIIAHCDFYCWSRQTTCANKSSARFHIKLIISINL